MLGYLIVAAATLFGLKYLEKKVAQSPAPAAAQTPIGSIVAPAQGFSPVQPNAASVQPRNELSKLRDLFAIGDATATTVPAAGAGQQDSPLLGPAGLCAKPYVASSEAGIRFARLS